MKLTISSQRILFCGMQVAKRRIMTRFVFEGLSRCVMEAAVE